MEQPAESREPAPDHAPDTVGGPGSEAFSCDELTIRYGGRVAVDRLSFAGRAGEVLALLGPNGAGKTSTVEALEGYRRPAGGRVAVLGLDPVRDRRALVPRIGVMLQHGGVYPTLGPAQVLSLFASYYDHPRDPGELLELTELTDVRRTPWRRLSGGEQQRLALALALVGRPEVVFLDEPTAGVDPEGRIGVRRIIATLAETGIGVLLTTHELAEAERLAHRVVIVHRGRKLAEGAPAALAAAASDGSIRFSTDPGIDTASALDAVPDGWELHEESPGSYRLSPTGARGGTDRPAVGGGLPDTLGRGTAAAGPAYGPGAPDVIAALTGWLASHGHALGELRTGRTLEETYLAITGQARQDGTGGPPKERAASRDEVGR
ncbi:MAG: ABC transporter ATP-binding protein [Actinomycetota bacterium]|nr:ABC transporter ATP-binding protein [Actinomycetota bacterium]